MIPASDLPDIRISVCSGPLAARKALDALMTALAPLALSFDDMSTIEVVMAEALNNVVEHAYPEGDAPGPIDLHCSAVAGSLHVALRDVGRVMPNEAPPAGDLINLDVDFENLPEGGFGWFLIKDLAENVTYERVGEENRLSFQLPVGDLLP